MLNTYGFPATIFHGHDRHSDLDLLILTDRRLVATNSPTLSLPTVVYDAAALDARRNRSRSCLFSEISLHHARWLLAGYAAENPPSGSWLLRSDEDGRPIAYLVHDHLIYSLPIFLTLEIDSPTVFRALSKELFWGICRLLRRDTFWFLSPWPQPYRSAMAMTFDLDHPPPDSRALDIIEGSAAESTLFLCSADVDLVQGRRTKHEIAAHGDFHKPFRLRKQSRLRQMIEVFQRANLEISGFSPPDLEYWGKLESLGSLFEYARTGYMEELLLFFPLLKNKLTITPISFYTDHRLRASQTGYLESAIHNYIIWSKRRRHLVTLCFHPFIYSFYTDFLHFQDSEIWHTSMIEIVRWWKRRNIAIEAIKKGDSQPTADDPGLEWVRANCARQLSLVIGDEQTEATKRRPFSIVECNAGHGQPGSGPAECQIAGNSAPAYKSGKRANNYELRGEGGFSSLYLKWLKNYAVFQRDSAGHEVVIPLGYGDEFLRLEHRSAADGVRQTIKSLLRWGLNAWHLPYS
jgi:hypothetical protein